MRKTAVIGIGSYQGEDQLGWLVIDELEKKYSNNPSLTLFKSKGNGLDWSDAVSGACEVFFIDAVISDEEFGFIHFFEINSEFDREKNILGQSSHSVNLVDSIMVAHNIGLLKLPVSFIGAEIGFSEQKISIDFEVIVKKLLIK